MNCLKDYVGLKYCTAETPVSNLWVNQLPGMSTELLDNIANSEQVNFIQVWDDIQERSYVKIKNDLINLLSDQVKFNSVVYQTRKLLKAQRNPVTVAMSDKYTGIYFMLPESRYSQLRLNEIYVYSFQTVSSVVKVWDVNDGVELYSKDINLVPGLNTIDISKAFDLKYRVQEYFIGVDTSGFDSIQTLNDYYYWWDEDLACAVNSTFGYSIQRGYFQLYPGTLIKGNDVTFDNIVKNGIGQGVAIGAEILCSVDQFICENKQHFSEAWLYLLGKETLLEKYYAPVGSKRMNYFTATNKENTNQLIADFDFNYTDRLKKKIKAIPLNGQSLCFSCDDAERVSYKGMMP